MTGVWHPTRVLASLSLSANIARITRLLVFTTPSVALLLLAVFAMRGERDATAREFSAWRTSTAQELASEVEGLCREDLRRYAAGETVASGIGDYVELDADGSLRQPRVAPPLPNTPEADVVCERRAAAFARLSSSARVRELEALPVECPAVRSASGRHLIPLALTEHPTTADAIQLQRWLDVNGDTLSERERALVDSRMHASSLSEAQVQEIHRKLDTPDRVIQVVAELVGEAAIQRALSGTPAHTPLLLHGNAGLLAVVRMTDGSWRGTAVTALSLSRDGARATLHVPDGLRMVVEAEPTEPAPSRVRLANAVALRIDIADGAVDKRTSRTRTLFFLVLGVVGSLFALLAVYLELEARKRERLTELRTDYGAALSHEIRTPAASLLLLSEMLAEGSVSEPELPHVYASLASESHRLTTVLSRMLELKRLSTDTAEEARGRLEVGSVSALVRATVHAFARRVPNAEIEERYDEVTAPLDSPLLATAIDNLLENARKYGKSPIAVRVFHRGSAAIIEVEDHGEGIPVPLRKSLFEPFDRGDRTRLNDATSGLGIGLSLVRMCATIHGGRATIASGKDGGAIFSLSLAKAVPAIGRRAKEIR